MDVDIPDIPDIPVLTGSALLRQHTITSPPSDTLALSPISRPYGLYPEDLVSTAELPKPAREWAYEMRHGMQNVADGLWVGSARAAKEFQDLFRKGITHVLILRDEREAMYVKPTHPLSFTYKIIEMKDDQASRELGSLSVQPPCSYQVTNERIITYFNPAIDYIEQAIRGGGGVFVYCHTGITLSPTIVIAYLMAIYRKTAEEAIAHVQAHRYCMSVKPNFGKQLREFQAIYQAQLDLALHSRPAESQKPKRGADDMYDDEEVGMNETRQIRTMRANNVWIRNGVEQGEYRPWL